MQKARTERRQKRYQKQNKALRILITAAACVLALGASFTIWAKYYKTGHNKGMAIASGFYFSSNYMTSVEGIKDKKIEDIAQADLEKLVTFSNAQAWKGTDVFQFDLEVRNYDNQLLFNDRDLNVEYTVSFMLLEEPKGANYSVSKADSGTAAGGGSSENPLKWESGKGTPITFTKQVLPGGSPRSDQFRIKIALTGSGGGQPADAYQPVPILVVAYPTGPDYLKGTKWIAGIIKADYEEREFRIEDGTGFTIRSTQEYQDNWKEAVKAESGYVYRLITSGNYAGGDTGSTRKKIKLKWNSDLFKINENDENYKAAVAKGNLISEETIDGVPWKVMEMEVLPYASIKFVFFRNSEDFETKIKAMDKESFEKSVQVELVQ